MASDSPSLHHPSVRLGHAQSLLGHHFMTQERLMFSNPTPSEPRFSPVATMSDDML